jgi:hypothetical protein
MAKGISESEWIKLIQESPKSLIASNSKLAKSNIYQFSLPAFAASVVKNGKLITMKTCPAAGACGKYCYSSQGAYLFNTSMVAHTRNLNLYLTDKNSFKSKLIEQIGFVKNLKAFRIHDSADFFNREYTETWFEIMKALPHIQFYAYTKQVLMFNSLRHLARIPKNFTYIFSYGGKLDGHIKPEVDRHSKVFSSFEEMTDAGYSDTTETDDNAADPSIIKIGLVYHGKKKFSRNVAKDAA